MNAQWARRRQIDVAGQKLPLIFDRFLSLTCPRNYPHLRGLILKEDKNPLLLWGRDSLGGILGDNLGEGNCESKIGLRDSRGDNL